MLYKINTPRPVRTGHTALVAPPLALIMIFCFVMVLVQPHPASTVPAKSAASSQSAPTAAGSQTILPPLNFVPASPLSAIAPPTMSVPIAAPITATPQPVTLSNNPLQAATLSTQQLTAVKPTIIAPPKTIIQSKPTTPPKTTTTNTKPK